MLTVFGIAAISTGTAYEVPDDDDGYVYATSFSRSSTYGSGTVGSTWYNDGNTLTAIGSIPTIVLQFPNTKCDRLYYKVTGVNPPAIRAFYTDGTSKARIAVPWQTYMTLNDDKYLDYVVCVSSESVFIDLVRGRKD
ncbi:hypothetical protein WKT22_02157 [Candidatus Lokiarchaeum ossiferum]